MKTNYVEVSFDNNGFLKSFTDENLYIKMSKHSKRKVFKVDQII